MVEGSSRLALISPKSNYLHVIRRGVKMCYFLFFSASLLYFCISVLIPSDITMVYIVQSFCIVC